MSEKSREAEEGIPANNGQILEPSAAMVGVGSGSLPSVPSAMTATTPAAKSLSLGDFQLSDSSLMASTTSSTSSPSLSNSYRKWSQDLEEIHVTNKTTILRIKRDLTEFYACAMTTIHVVPEEDNISRVHALIQGPSGTPYMNGFFYFVIQFPADYPIKPPKVKLLTTGHNTVGFNPNLYANGYVCLSILNTWSGPQWSPVMNLTSVLLSIQSLMNEEPYYNEPGREYLKAGRGVGGANANAAQKAHVAKMLSNVSQCSQQYNETIRHETIRVAVLDMMEDSLDSKAMPQPLKDIMIESFKANYYFYEDLVLEKIRCARTPLNKQTSSASARVTNNNAADSTIIGAHERNQEISPPVSPCPVMMTTHVSSVIPLKKKKANEEEDQLMPTTSVLKEQSKTKSLTAEAFAKRQSLSRTDAKTTTSQNVNKSSEQKPQSLIGELLHSNSSNTTTNDNDTSKKTSIANQPFFALSSVAITGHQSAADLEVDDLMTYPLMSYHRRRYVSPNDYPNLLRRFQSLKKKFNISEKVDNNSVDNKNGDQVMSSPSMTTSTGSTQCSSGAYSAIASNYMDGSGGDGPGGGHKGGRGAELNVEDIIEDADYYMSGTADEEEYDLEYESEDSND